MLRIGGADRMSRMAALSKVASKSVDFAVVELASGDVVLVVELDDRSHDQTERRERDAFVNAVLEYSGIPIRRFRPETPIHLRDFFVTAGVASR
jgi:very-short-patch-repair endonuclease